MYAVWPDYSEGLPRVVISWSPDRGLTWSDPKPVAPRKIEGSQQFQAAVAVNRDGVVGVTWYDSREAPSEFAFHQYFAASFDGGETFTDAQRVSGALSRPLGSGNLLPTPTTFSGTQGELRVALLSAASRWVNGGDYMGLTASADGHFHPVLGGRAVWNLPGLHRRSPSRVRRTCGTTGAKWHADGRNGVRNGGARFVYDSTLGTEGVLPPGGVSGAILWRFRLIEPIRIPNLHAYVSGRR